VASSSSAPVTRSLSPPSRRSAAGTSPPCGHCWPDTLADIEARGAGLERLTPLGAAIRAGATDLADWLRDRDARTAADLR
jgi:hypothetical protein